jgi:hypothetical protein
MPHFIARVLNTVYSTEREGQEPISPPVAELTCVTAVDGSEPRSRIHKVGALCQVPSSGKAAAGVDPAEVGLDVAGLMPSRILRARVIDATVTALVITTPSYRAGCAGGLAAGCSCWALSARHFSTITARSRRLQRRGCTAIGICSRIPRPRQSRSHDAASRVRHIPHRRGGGGGEAGTRSDRDDRELVYQRFPEPADGVDLHRSNVDDLAKAAMRPANRRQRLERTPAHRVPTTRFSDGRSISRSGLGSHCQRLDFVRRGVCLVRLFSRPGDRGRRPPDRRPTPS